MKKNKFFHIALLFVLSLAQNTIAANTLGEDNSSDITIKLPAMNVIAGKNLSVPIETSQIDSSLSIVSYQYNLSFDNSKLEFKGVNQISTLSSAGVIEVNSLTPGKLRIACINAHPLKGLGKLMNIEFKAIAAGSSALQLTDFLFNTDTVKNIASDTIKIFTKYGDTDSNDFIQAYDAALVLQHSVGLEPLSTLDSIPWENWRMVAADVDLVNNLTANDAGLILKKSIGLIDLFPAELNNSLAAKAPLLNTADVTITKEWENLVFRSYGNLIGLNLSLSDNYTVLDQPVEINNKFMNATNINDNTYRVGLATANPPADGTVIMTIPIKESNQTEIMVKLVINNQFKDIKANVLTANNSILADKIRIYPNPTADLLNIDLNGISGEQKYLIISNLMGQIVYKSVLSTSITQINLKDIISKGIYHAKVMDENMNEIAVKKLMLQ